MTESKDVKYITETLRSDGRYDVEIELENGIKLPKLISYQPIDKKIFVKKD
ncbi:hypothetical protein ACSBQ3_02525 [Staphylococcus equorum]|uniref:hypothetical protein n=1 Tax=Staphylococcus equorum TaxID=246432 RepID=UPI003EB85BF9